MAIFLDRVVAEAVSNLIVTEPGTMYLCHVVPNFEAEWNKHTDSGTLGQYLYRHFTGQYEAFEAANPDEVELARSVRAYLVLNMPPLFYMIEGEFGRALDDTIRAFFRERGV